MYIRFVVGKKDDLSGLRLGVFSAAYDLRRSGKLSHYEDEKITQSIEWFKKNLKVPDKLTTSSRHNAPPKAIGWYKDSAKECISECMI